MDHETVAAYLNRVGVTAPAFSDAASLRTLHRAHQLAVPFEKLSIHLAEPISLDERDLIGRLTPGGRVSIAAGCSSRPRAGPGPSSSWIRTTCCWRRTGTTSASC